MAQQLGSFEKILRVGEGRRMKRLADQAAYITSLEPDFRERVKRFISCLRAGGANIVISSTRRHPGRAYVVHYAWDIATSGWRRSWTLSCLLVSGQAGGPHAARHSFARNRRAFSCKVRK